MQESVFRYNERSADSYSCKFLLASNSSYFLKREIYIKSEKVMSTFDMRWELFFQDFKG